MSEQLAQFYFRQIVAGLAALHSQNVVRAWGRSRGRCSRRAAVCSPARWPACASEQCW